MTWITFLTTVAAQVTGPIGIPLYVLLLAWGGIQVATSHRWHALGYIVAGGVITFSAAWFVNTYMAA